MSTTKPMSVSTSGRCSWMFAWTVQMYYGGRETRSNPFYFKGHEVYLRLCSSGYGLNVCHSVYLYAPPSFPSLSLDDMIFRVETKNKTPLDLPKNTGVGPNDKRFWHHSQDNILAKYPDFNQELILTFLVCNVDPPKANPVRSSDLSSLESLSADLSVLLQNQDSGPDLELLCGEDHSIKVHKNIVCARSKVMSTMLNSDMSESRTGRIDIKDMSSEVFDHFVHYLYAGKLPDLNVDIARGLYEAGDQYEMPSLMRQSASFLEENLTPENACELLVLADAHSDQEFKENVMDYIIENKIPLQEDHWLPFNNNYQNLAIEVLYRLCKWLDK